MARYEFRLPDVGEGITESEIAGWKVNVGDVVNVDQPLVDMLTEKAAVEIASPVAGTVIELGGQPGDMIAVGATLVVIETSAAEAVQNVTAANKPRAAATLEPRTGSLTLAAPAVRQRASQLGIELARLRGTGPEGRITHADLDTYLARRTPSAPARETPPRALRDGETKVEIMGLRRRIAEAMQRSTQRIPHFSYVEEVDVTELEALRAQLNAGRKPDQPRLSPLPFLMRALVKVLPDFPQINATFDDAARYLIQSVPVHIGIATQTPRGLLVPVVRHAEKLDLWTAASEIARLAGAAREGKALRDDLSGSTITITSLGAMGGILTTPIINSPEVAIVGINSIRERPVVRQGQVVTRKMVNLSSSFDHRIVDGWDAAAFIQEIKAVLEQPVSLHNPQE